MFHGRLGTLCLGLVLVPLSGCSQLTLTSQTPLARPAAVEEAMALASSPVAGGDRPGADLDLEHPGAQRAARISTVAAPEAARRPIALAECICIALERGRTGDFYDRVGSDRRTSVVGLTNQASASGSSDAIRVFAIDPAVAATDVEQALARFDAIWRTSAVWNAVQRPPGVSPDEIPVIGVGVVNRQLDNVQFRSELIKPLPTGGVAGITFRNDYGRANVQPGAGILNPAYQPGTELTFEQPLLQNGGVLINQLRDTFPAALRHPIPSGATPGQARTPAILLARINTEQTRIEFERRVHELVLAVEEAYWDLYGAYWDLYSRENGLRQAHLAWQIGKQRYDAGGVSDDDFAQLEEQYHFFRTSRLEALGRGSSGRPGVLEAERRLRYVVGLPAEDGTRLIPTDAPVTTPLTPDWAGAVQSAHELRPELRQIHKEIQLTQLLLVRAQNYLLPDLRFFSRYGLNGLDNNLGDALRNMAVRPFANWELGLQLEVPIGMRAGNAETTRAKLLLGQRYAFLRDQESKLFSTLQRSYRDLVQFREEILTRRSQREAVAVQLRARYERFKGGKESIDLLVRTQRNWADALRDEYAAVCKYNIALADFERQKGTILAYHNVTVVEGLVPHGARDRASHHLRAAHQSQLTEKRSAVARGQSADRLTELMRPDPERILGFLDTPADEPIRPGTPAVGR